MINIIEAFSSECKAMSGPCLQPHAVKTPFFHSMYLCNVQNWPDALLDCDLWNQWPFTCQVIALTTALGSNVRKFHKALEEPPVSLFPPSPKENVLIVL